MTRDVVSPRTRLRTRRLDAAGAVLVLVAAGVTGATVAVASPAAQEAGALPAIAELPQTAADRLPAGFPAEAHGSGGLVLSTSRFLGRVDTTSPYWIVRDRAGDVCLVLVDGARGTTGAACGSARDLEGDAISLSVAEGTDGGYQAFLVGDRFAASPVGEPWVRAGKNLIAIPLEEAEGARLELRQGGSTVDLVPFATR